jgi:hypothetical protein
MLMSTGIGWSIQGHEHSHPAVVKDGKSQKPLWVQGLKPILFQMLGL